MTHTPTLPNGFSRDFSEAPRHRWFVAWQDDGENGFSVLPMWRDGAGRFTRVDDVQMYPRSDHLLCWAEFPTPGDAVLKELAEKANG